MVITIQEEKWLPRYRSFINQKHYSCLYCLIGPLKCCFTVARKIIQIIGIHFGTESNNNHPYGSSITFEIEENAIHFTSALMKLLHSDAHNLRYIFYLVQLEFTTLLGIYQPYVEVRNHFLKTELFAENNATPVSYCFII